MSNEWRYFSPLATCSNLINTFDQGTKRVRSGGNTYQSRPRRVGARLEILHDISVVPPIINQSELKDQHVNSTEWEDVLVSQSLPDGHKFPKDLLCFLEVLRGIDAEGFEGHLLVVQRSSPNIGGSTRRNRDFPAFREPLKQSDRVGEQTGVAGDIP